MFRRMVTRMGLLALGGLGLLLVAGPAKADTQGWPLQGRNTQGSSYQGQSYRAFSPYSYGSYSPSYYAAYPTSIPQSQTEGYYGSASTEDYYRTSTPPASTERAVRINLRVPADAKIWFDGRQTFQTGTARSFQSPPLAVGPEYAYQVRIQWNRDGKEGTQTRQILVHAGDEISLTVGSAPGFPRPQ
jgi:uncharacterized protein (TIGR03000 family)